MPAKVGYKKGKSLAKMPSGSKGTKRGEGYTKRYDQAKKRTSKRGKK